MKVIEIPSSSQKRNIVSHEPMIEIPTWQGKLKFRQAMHEESPELKGLYEASWGNGIKITKEQIESKIANFPEGQIVGYETGTEKPISMINIMLAEFLPAKGFTKGYEKVSGGRTFSTNLSFNDVLKRRETVEDMLAIALCVSIAVHPLHARNGYAHETLNYAIKFAEINGLIAVPYSAPRGFGNARMLNPDLDIITYLHMTNASDTSYESFVQRIAKLESQRRIRSAFPNRDRGVGMIRKPVESIFNYYRDLGDDCIDRPFDKTAYSKFLVDDGKILSEIYGREMTIEDFCLLSGRKHIDPTMRMHIENGARFIRDNNGLITAVFENSRVEDIAAAGYNVILSYGYNKLFGHEFAE